MSTLPRRMGFSSWRINDVTASDGRVAFSAYTCTRFAWQIVRLVQCRCRDQAKQSPLAIRGLLRPFGARNDMEWSNE